jgi:hypothetical protein
MGTVEKLAWIPICCVCHQVRDDRQSSQRVTRNGSEQWMTLKSFLRLYRIARGAYTLTHTYCPQCMLLQLGPKLGEKLVHLRAETTPAEVRGRIVSAVSPVS